MLYILFVRAQENFRVYIFLPLLPGFDDVSSVLNELYFIMCSTTKGEGSLFSRLKIAGKIPSSSIASLISSFPLLYRHTSR